MAGLGFVLGCWRGGGGVFICFVVLVFILVYFGEGSWGGGGIGVGLHFSSTSCAPKLPASGGLHAELHSIRLQRC